MTRWTHTAACLAFAAALPAFDASAAQRTFVSTGGSDANACSLAAPCRGFAKAITVTDPGGELVVLDSGGYGSVTVTQNVTILSPAGVYAGISVFGGTDGVTVMAPATNVVLRGLTITGQGGNNGIRVQTGEVHVENTVVSGMAQAGILVEGGTTVRISGSVLRSNVDGLRVLPAAGTVTVLVRDSEVSNNGQIGMRISPAGAGNGAMVTVERTSVTKHSGYGIYSGPGGGGTATIVVTQSVLSENAVAGVASAGSGATIWVRESAVTRNGTGLWQGGSGVLNACGANLLVANTTATAGTINTATCLDVASGSGTVTSVATGVGLTGGPITTTGTVNLAATNLLPTVPCAANQVPQWNGAAWACATAATGTVTSLSQGTGITLSANPITTTGSIAADTAYLQRRVSGTCAVGSSIRTINADGTVSCQADGPVNAFVLGGNNFGANAILGTNDDNPLTLKVNNSRIVRYEPNAISPNIIGGFLANSVLAGLRGATIAGGGALANSDPDFPGEAPNRVTDAYGTVGGGNANRAGDDAGTTTDNAFATVGGGQLNVASRANSTVGGGYGNAASGTFATVGGGNTNNASGTRATIGGGQSNDTSGDHSTIAGGGDNDASGSYGTIGGGWNNSASGSDSVVSGGYQNVASGLRGAVPGGLGNTAAGDYSFAAGFRAKANHTGAFVWADSSPFDFASGSTDSFRVRATGGGVRFVVALNPDGSISTNCLLNSVSGGWNCSSDRNLKNIVRQLDGKAVLDKLATMPIFEWSPKAAPDPVRHFGPTAQDFRAVFGLGDSDLHIGAQDADGVALAAIQGLYSELRERDATIAELHSRLTQVESLRDDLIALRAALGEALGARALLARQETTRREAR